MRRVFYGDIVIYGLPFFTTLWSTRRSTTLSLRSACWSRGRHGSKSSCPSSWPSGTVYPTFPSPGGYGTYGTMCTNSPFLLVPTPHHTRHYSHSGVGSFSPPPRAHPNLSNVLRKQSNKTRNQTKQKKTKFLSPALLLPLWIPLLQCPDLNESQVCFKNPFALPNPNPDPSSLYRHRWSFAE
jgi:hypothetical protein